MLTYSSKYSIFENTKNNTRSVTNRFTYGYILGQLMPRGTRARDKILSGSGSSAMGVMVLMISRNAYS